jgi:hypothetical protein
MWCNKLTFDQAAIMLWHWQTCEVQACIVHSLLLLLLLLLLGH